MVRNRFVGTALIVIVTGVTLSAFPWIRDMWVGPVVLPSTLPLIPPADALPIDGLQRMNRIDARDKLANPRAITPEVLAAGADLYGIFCASCHGAAGAGDGAVAEHFRRMPDLTVPYVQEFADGWLFSIIREGGVNMPPFSSDLSADERWAVVHHIRTLSKTTN